MHLQQLYYFVNLAQTEHMTKSAKLLKTSQPNLSYTIHELEKEIGVPLFEKHGRNIRLTNYGKLYFRYAQSALQQLETGHNMIQDAVDPFHGKISIGFIYTMGNRIVPELSKLFNQSHPNVSLSFKQNNSQKLLEALVDNQIDIAIVSQIESFEHVDFTPLLVEELVAVLPKDHHLAKQKELSLNEISKEPLVYYDESSGLRYYLDNIFKDANLKPNPVVEVEEDHTILGFVSQEYGIAILPDLPSISAYQVEKRPISNDYTPRQIYIATRKADYVPPIISEFKNFCLNNINTIK